MADSRLYIVNARLGIGCRFYARLGGQYTMGNPEAMKALLDKVADELVLNDEFFITDNEACIDKIEGSMLVRFDSEALRQSNAEKDRMEEERMEAFSASRKEVVFLKNRIATLSNRLISAGLDPT